MILLVILILLMLPVTVYGQLRGVNTKGQFANDAYCYDVSFANIHEAIDTAAAWNATLYITQTNTMSTSRDTVPANVTLHFMRGGLITGGGVGGGRDTLVFADGAHIIAGTDSIMSFRGPVYDVLYWGENNTDHVNFAWFGAVGDSTANNLWPLVAAFKANLYHPYMIHVYEGKYYVSTNIGHYNNMLLKGVGFIDSVKFCFADAVTNCFVNADNLHLENLYFYLPHQDASGAGLFSRYQQNSVNGDGTGDLITGGWYQKPTYIGYCKFEVGHRALRMGYTKNAVIEHNEVWGSIIAVISVANGGSNNKIMYNKVTQLPGENVGHIGGITLSVDSSYVMHNEVHANFYPFDLEGVTNTIVGFNKAFLDSGLTAAMYTTEGSGNTIIGNHLYTNSTHSATYCIYVRSRASVDSVFGPLLVTDNICYGYGKSMGVYVSLDSLHNLASEGSIFVTGNTFYNVTAPMYIQGDVSYTQANDSVWVEYSGNRVYIATAQITINAAINTIINDNLFVGWDETTAISVIKDSTNTFFVERNKFLYGDVTDVVSKGATTQPTVIEHGNFIYPTVKATEQRIRGFTLVSGDSVQFGGGIWMRKMFLSVTGDSLGTIFYNSTKARIDTAWANTLY